MYPAYQEPLCLDRNAVKYISSFIRISEWRDVFYLHLLHYTNQEISDATNYSVRSVQRIISRCYDIVVGELFRVICDIAPHFVERKVNE